MKLSNGEELDGTPVLESRWTQPRVDCPYPGYWHSTDPQSTELEVTELIAGFVRALQPEYVLETGSCIGSTSQLIGLALHENGHGHLDSLEIEPKYAEIARARCQGLPVTVHLRPSLEFKPEREIDFLFLDSEISIRIKEFERFREHLSNRAIVGFHDTGPQFGEYGPDIRKLPGVHTLQLATPRGVTFLQLG